MKFSLAAALLLASSAAAFDVTRTHTGLVSAGNSAEIATKINLALEEHNVQDCHNFSLEELNELLLTLVLAKSEHLDEHYSAQADKRSLRSKTTSDFENAWSKELFEVGRTGNAHGVILALKEAKCAEALMMFAHHLTDEQQAELAQVTGLKLPTIKEFNVNHLKTDSALVSGTYAAAMTCIDGHDIETASDSDTDHVLPHWPAEVHWTGQGHNAYPFWTGGGGPPGVSGGKPKGRRRLQSGMLPGDNMETWWSEKQGHEKFYHQECSMSTAGYSDDVPCYHLMLGPAATKVSYLYTASEDYCCDSTGRSQPLTAPQSDFMDLMDGPTTISSYSADYYSGEVKYYLATGANVVDFFWYITDPSGNPVEQGEGGKTNTDGSGKGVHIWHTYDTFNSSSIDPSVFEIPTICVGTTNKCQGI